MEFFHRVTDPERSIAFYEALGLEKRRELPIRDEAINYFIGVPRQPQPELELTYAAQCGSEPLRVFRDELGVGVA